MSFHLVVFSLAVHVTVVSLILLFILFMDKERDHFLYTRQNYYSCHCLVYCRHLLLLLSSLLSLLLISVLQFALITK